MQRQVKQRKEAAGSTGPVGRSGGVEAKAEAVTSCSECGKPCPPHPEGGTVVCSLRCFDDRTIREASTKFASSPRGVVEPGPTPGDSSPRPSGEELKSAHGEFSNCTTLDRGSPPCPRCGLTSAWSAHTTDEGGEYLRCLGCGEAVPAPVEGATATCRGCEAEPATEGADLCDACHLALRVLRAGGRPSVVVDAAEAGEPLNPPAFVHAVRVENRTGLASLKVEALVVRGETRAVLVVRVGVAS